MAGIAAMAIAYVLSQFFRSFLAVLTPALMADLAISKAELSLASGAWFASFALMQFAVGMSLDSYGPKRTTALMFGVFGGGGALLFAAATAPWMIILALALIGAGCAPMLMAGMFVFARSFPPARLAVLTACFMAVGSAGNVVGTTPLAAAAAAYGWRGVIFAIGLFAIAVALALLALVRDPPRDPLAADHVGGFAGFLAVIRINRLWPVIPLIALGHAPMIGILGLWSGPYLSDVYGADALTIGHTTFFMSIAVVGGSLLYGLLDTVFARKWLIVLGNASAVLVLAWLALAPEQGIAPVTLCFVLVALFGSSFPLIMAHARSFIPLHLTGRGITLLNFFSIGGVGIVQILSGAVVTTATVPDQPAFAYAALFAAYALALAAALAIYLYAQPGRAIAGDTEPATAP